jgi:hypothetical protein
VGSTVQYAWKKAAECAARADETSDKDIRIFFTKLRDSWISVANRHELLESMDDRLPHEQLPIATDVPPGPSSLTTDEGPRKGLIR